MSLVANQPVDRIAFMDVVTKGGPLQLSQLFITQQTVQICSGSWARRVRILETHSLALAGESCSAIKTTATPRATPGQSQNAPGWRLRYRGEDTKQRKPLQQRR